MRRRVEPFIPASYHSVGATLNLGGTVRASCDRCRVWHDVDLARIGRLRGLDYSLIGKRTRCRLTPGCTGWIRFHYLNGVMRPLWRDADDARWEREDASLRARD